MENDKQIEALLQLAMRIERARGDIPLFIAPEAAKIIRQVTEERAAIADQQAVQPPYPNGVVVGPCVCGSWPGGECLKCKWIPARPTDAAKELWATIKILGLSNDRLALQAITAAIAASAQDAERLNHLDALNARKNANYGTSYGWRIEENHNRIALSDHWFPALTVRQAIDEHMDKCAAIATQSAIKEPKP